MASRLVGIISRPTWPRNLADDKVGETGRGGLPRRRTRRTPPPAPPGAGRRRCRASRPAPPRPRSRAPRPGSGFMIEREKDGSNSSTQATPRWQWNASDGAGRLHRLRARQGDRVFSYAPTGVSFARVKLSIAADPAVGPSRDGAANLDVNGRLVRAQVAAETMFEAIDELHDRLQRRLGRASAGIGGPRGGRPLPGLATADGSEPAGPPAAPASVEEREIVRAVVHPGLRDAGQGGALRHGDASDSSSSCSPTPRPGRTASSTRATAGTARTGGPGPDRKDPGRRATDDRPHPVPAERVRGDAAPGPPPGSPWGCSSSTTPRPGNVIYRRYDGNYGLITPA